jgi:hypothetical protein
VSKYHATKTVIDSIAFASKREAARYTELKLMQRAGLISDLRRQVKYELIPKQQGERAVSYIADFVYTEDGKTVVEDVKGVRTPVYKIKKKLMLWRHGVKIREV